MPFITRGYSTFDSPDIWSDVRRSYTPAGPVNIPLPAASKLNHWLSNCTTANQTTPRTSSFGDNMCYRRCSIESSTDGSSTCGSPPAADNYSSSPSPSSTGSSCHSTPQKASSLSLAELFDAEWDPKFAAYLRQSRVSSRPTSRRLIPENQLPTAANNFSISNYTIELILSLGMKNGYGCAEQAIQDLLQFVPLHVRHSHKTKLLQRAQLLTKKRNQLPLCAFCRNNGEPAYRYTQHTLRDPWGKVVCPILRAYTCPKCGAHGDNAHTLTYCPLNRNLGGNHSLTSMITQLACLRLQ